MPLRRLAARTVLGLVLAGAAPGAVQANETVIYTYDALGRLKAVQSTGTVNDGQAFSYCYDAAGNRTQASTSSAGTVLDCPDYVFPPPPPPPLAPSIAIGNASVFEGEAAAFAVTLSEAYTSSISVSYATAYGSAGSSDFTAKSGTLTFAAGEVSKTILISTTSNLMMEGTESFAVNLSGPTGGATIADGQGNGTIYDDDQDPMCGEFLC